MEMYENLCKLEMTGNPTDPTPDLTEWATGKALAIVGRTESLNTASFAAAIAFGFVFGVAYESEYGIPDCSKNLITVK